MLGVGGWSLASPLSAFMLLEQESPQRRKTEEQPVASGVVEVRTMQPGLRALGVAPVLPKQAYDSPRLVLVCRQNQKS